MRGGQLVEVRPVWLEAVFGCSLSPKFSDRARAEKCQLDRLNWRGWLLGCLGGSHSGKHQQREQDMRPE
jgi:hypothetical protein